MSVCVGGGCWPKGWGAAHGAFVTRGCSPPAPPPRLLENQTIFKAADETLTTSIAKLDSDIASLTNAALQKFMSLQAKHAHALLGIYTASLDSIGAPSSAAVAAIETHAAEIAADAEGGEHAAPAAAEGAAEDAPAPAAAVEEHAE